VSPWKVILATLAIFIAGLITGSVMVKTLVNPMPPRPVPQNPVLLQPGPIREEFVRRMTEELELTPEQREKVLHIVHESQERTKLLYSLIGDDVREEMRQTRDSIRQQLTGDQAKKFDDMLRRRQRRLQLQQQQRAEDDDIPPPRFAPEGPRFRGPPNRPGGQPAPSPNEPASTPPIPQ